MLFGLTTNGKAQLVHLIRVLLESEAAQVKQLGTTLEQPLRGRTQVLVFERILSPRQSVQVVALQSIQSTSIKAQFFIHNLLFVKSTMYGLIQLVHYNKLSELESEQISQLVIIDPHNGKGQVSGVP